MRKKKLTKDQFARFIARRIMECKSYSFDLLYDLQTIMTEFNRRNEDEHPARKEYHLFCRDTGFDLAEPGASQYSTFESRNARIYSLEFFWNCNRHRSDAFCTVKRIK